MDAARAGETWRPVAGWPNYEVSCLGRVRSVDCTITDKLGRTRSQRGRLLRTQVDAGGYRRVELRHATSRYTTSVHRLVALAFLGQPAAGQEVRHLDGDSLHNVPANLAWGTHAENVADTQRHGRYRHRNAEKVRCPRDHPYSGVNARGDRVCHTCMREWQRSYKRRRAA